MPPTGGGVPLLELAVPDDDDDVVVLPVPLDELDTFPVPPVPVELVLPPAPPVLPPPPHAAAARTPAPTIAPRIVRAPSM
jgi:hypothetical protein